LQLCAGRHIQQVLDDLQKADPVVAIAEEFVLVGRVCVMLRGLGFVLQQPRSTAVAWLPIAKQCLCAAGQWDAADEVKLTAALGRRAAAEVERAQYLQRILDGLRDGAAVTEAAVTAAATDTPGQGQAKK